MLHVHGWDFSQQLVAWRPTMLIDGRAVVPSCSGFLCPPCINTFLFSFLALPSPIGKTLGAFFSWAKAHNMFWPKQRFPLGTILNNGYIHFLLIWEGIDHPR